MKAATLLSTFLLSTTLLWPYPPSAEPLVEAFKKVQPAVGALYAQGTDGSLRFNCTVTAVEKAEGRVLLLTANHCVTKGVSYLVSFDGKRFYNAQVFRLPKEELDPQKYRRKYGEPKVDMAFFIISEPLEVSTIPLGSDEKIEAGTRIIVVGFPLGVSKINYEGIVAGRLHRPGADNDGYLLLQSFGAPGSSGSAVIDVASLTVISILVGAVQESVGLPVLFSTPISYQKYLKDVHEDVKEEEKR